MLVKRMFLANEGISSDLTAQSAQTYAWFAGILAGFAFAGLAVYLGRNNDRPVNASACPTVTQVAATLFYAMSSLTICTFLYISLVADPNSYRVFLAGLVYGPALGLSVLSLFYAMLLMMLEHDAIKEAARHAPLVVIIAGPILVIRFLAYHLYWALQVRCGQPNSPDFLCRTDGPLWTGGIFVVTLGIILGVIFSAMVIMIHAVKIRNLIKTGNLTDEECFSILRMRIVAKLPRPSSLVFILVSIIALLSALIPTRGSVTDLSNRVVYVTLGGGSCLLAMFSIFVWLCYKQINFEANRVIPQESSTTQEEQATSQ